MHKKPTWTAVDDDERDLHQMVSEILREDRRELLSADIILAWNNSWRANKDGYTQKAQLTLISKLDATLFDHDFVLCLNETWYRQASPTDRGFEILNALCAGRAVMVGESLDQKVDFGSRVWRIAQPDVKVFSEAVAKYGIRTGSVENLRQIMVQSSLPFTEPEEETAEVPEEAGAAIPQALQFATAAAG